MAVSPQGILARLRADEAGQTAVEWVLILAFVGIPMVYVFRLLLGVLAETYKMVTFMQTLPFP